MVSVIVLVQQCLFVIANLKISLALIFFPSVLAMVVPENQLHFIYSIT